MSLAVVFRPVVPLSAQADAADDGIATVVCGSRPGERQTCAANTSKVTLLRSLGTVACELGTTWGYDQQNIWVSDGCSAEFSVPAAKPTFATYTPLQGFRVADTEYGDLNIRVYTYLRYLNQTGLDPTYTNAFGRTTDIQQRNDIQLNKAQVYFYGWILDPKFRYNLYIWTSNTSLGQTSQVVVAGNLRYSFSRHFTLGGGINALPGVRSTEGNFPFWLSMDARQIADEFFRPSYTTGIWADGNLTKTLTYQAMVGNNLSQFGIDAGQLDSGLNTISGMLAWMPTTGEFGRGFGDFQPHEKVATRLAVHGTRSRETRQGQPNNDAFENVQIRVSDGSVIFAPSVFAEGLQIEDATYSMVSIDAGVKYRGFSFDVEHYRRVVDDFTTRGTGVLPFSSLHDTGFQVWASAMLAPKQVRVYAGGSKVFGEFGNPSDVRVGVSYFPWKNEVVRWDVEFAHFNRSPVGALSLPYSVGSNGPILQSNFMVWF